MSLHRLRKQWDRFGLRDPFWAVLTVPGKKNSGWDPAEFFETGKSEIDGVLQYVQSIRPLPCRQRALDFGCGVGRLTQALAQHFDQVFGVDIAPSMIEHAGRYNQYGERCRYVLNVEPDLRIFSDGQFDFIYSNITLQHMPRDLAEGYLVEFLRVIAPGGVLLFQLPSRIRKDQSSAIERLIRKLYYDVFQNFLRPRTPYMEMHGIDKEVVARFLEAHGGKVLDVVPDNFAYPHWDGFRYLVARGD